MSKKKEAILQVGEKCKIEIDRDGIISTSNCPDLRLGHMDIEMLNKVKNIVTEENEVRRNRPKNI